MAKINSTDTQQFISDLTGGAFAQQIGMAISDVAESVVTHGKKGQVKITLDFNLSGDKENRQVNIKHKMDYTAPEKFGTRKEDYSRQTPMSVNDDGTVTLHANHTSQLFEHLGMSSEA